MERRQCHDMFLILNRYHVKESELETSFSMVVWLIYNTFYSVQTYKVFLIDKDTITQVDTSIIIWHLGQNNM